MGGTTLYERGTARLLGGGQFGGSQRELNFPWQDYFLSGSIVMAGSVAIAQLSASIPALRFTGTKNACPLWTNKPCPRDAALVNAAVSASSTVYLDWADGTGTDPVATISASLYAVANDDSLGSASLLGAVDTIDVTGGGAASDFNSSSLFNANAPVTRDSHYFLKFVHDSSDGDDDSGSNFHLLGLRLRYITDRLGD